jgi:hypothetical protein
MCKVSLRLHTDVTQKDVRGEGQGNGNGPCGEE